MICCNRPLLFIRQVDCFFFHFLRVAVGLVRPAIRMIHKGNYKVCVLRHPFIAVRDCKSLGFILDLGVNYFVISCFLILKVIFLILGSYIRRYEDQFGMWVISLICLAASISECVKAAVLAEKEFRRLVTDFFQKYFCQSFFQLRSSCELRMPTKHYDHVAPPEK